MFPSGKVRSWVEAAFEVTNTVLQKLSIFSEVSLAYYSVLFQCYVSASLSVNSLGKKEETEYCKY